MVNLQCPKRFYKKLYDQVDKILDELPQLTSKLMSIPNVSFNVILCHEIHKVIAIYACADVSNFKYRGVKMFLLKLGSELQKFS